MQNGSGDAPMIKTIGQEPVGRETAIEEAIVSSRRA